MEKEETPAKLCELSNSVPLTKNQVKEQNKILRNILIGIASVFVFMIIWGVISHYASAFKYQGINFEIEEYCDAKPCLLLYKTALPVEYHDKTTGNLIKNDYNFYLRNDPRKLENVPFTGKLNFMPNMVINMSEDFNCNGDGVIAIANLVKLYQVLGVEIIKDDNAGCDTQGRYMFLKIESANSTKIEQTGPACYTLGVQDCEILDVTERFMIESFIQTHEKLGL